MVLVFSAVRRRGTEQWNWRDGALVAAGGGSAAAPATAGREEETGVWD